MRGGSSSWSARLIASRKSRLGAFIFARELGRHATQCGDPEAVDLAVRLDRGGPCAQGRAMRVVPRILIGLHRLGQRSSVSDPSSLVSAASTRIATAPRRSPVLASITPCR